MKNRRAFMQTAGVTAGGVLAGALAGPAVASAQGAGPARTSPGARLRALLAGPDPVMTPGAHDVVSARLIQAEGFPAIIVGGSACSACMYGIPDVGLVSITELIEFAGRIARHVTVPVVADADDGGGTPINVYRAVQMFDKAGLAAVMIEDTYQAKHLGPGESLIPSDQMVDKVKAATDARIDPDLVIIGRNDSLAIGESLERAIERGVAYAEAGADMIFFSGLRLQDGPRARAAVQRPLMNTITSAPIDEIRRAQVNLVVYSGQLLGVGLAASQQVLREIRAGGVIPNYEQRAIAPADYARLLETPETQARARTYRVSK